MSFDTLLVANRGEIACRILRSARALGLRTVAVYSDVDRDARHVALADEALAIGAGPARDSYLSIERLLEACARSGAQAVHPGYGFLSENAAFARACRQAGLVFVGPPPEAIEALGNKAAAKQLAERIGVPCLPGYHGPEQSLPTLAREAARIGTPLMIKAAGGGGGRGMRRVDDLADFDQLAQRAREEAQAAFGNGELLLERLAIDARHVELQVLADSTGRCIHLGERDCSTQRRHQKLIEEAPAPGVSAALRDAMGAAAVRLAAAAGYVGAGTVEFLLEPGGAFYFLEMNTRLQVEHPVTEAITGLDLVELQLRIARGEALPIAQSDVRWRGHAIEARLCAEDAFAGFVPQSGTIGAWRLPGGDAIRVDHGLSASPAKPAQVSRFYDSLIAKLIAVGRDRDDARRRLLAALDEVSILGLSTNRDYLVRCLQAPAFAQARLHVGWLAEAAHDWRAPEPDDGWRAIAGALWVERHARAFGALAHWASSGPRAMPVWLGDGESSWRAQITVEGIAHRVELNGRSYCVELGPLAEDAGSAGSAGGEHRSATLDGRRLRCHLSAPATLPEPGLWLSVDGHTARLVDLSRRPPRRSESAGDGRHCATMHGQVVALSVAIGDRVAAGQTLLALEAMKMEHRITARSPGRVAEIGVAAGVQVAPGALLVRIEPATAEPAG